MNIAKEDIQSLIAVDVGALALLHETVMVFNLKTSHFTRLKIPDLLRSRDADRVVCLCEPEDQPPERPHPQRIDMSRFRKLDQDELGKGFCLNNLTFALEFTGDHLVISYKNQKVYEEPIYLLCQCDDDELDERMEDSIFFEYRIGSLSKALKTVYGTTARLKPCAEYPAIRVTQDITGWFCEQLEASFDDHRDQQLLAVLKLLLSEAGEPPVFDDFIKMVSGSIEDVDAVVDALFREYIGYCGVSAGYRTSIWDGMVAVYQYFNKDIDYEELIALIEKRFEQDEFKDFKDYDIIPTSVVSSIIFLNNLFRDNTMACRKELAIAMLCFSLTQSAY